LPFCIVSGDRLITNLNKAAWQGLTVAPIQGTAVAGLANYAGYAMFAGHEDFPDRRSFSKGKTG
jgi:hypothetical protein